MNKQAAEHLAQEYYQLGVKLARYRYNRLQTDGEPLGMLNPLDRDVNFENLVVGDALNRARSATGMNIVPYRDTLTTPGYERNALMADKYDMSQRDVDTIQQKAFNEGIDTARTTLGIGAPGFGEDKYRPTEPLVGDRVPFSSSSPLLTENEKNHYSI